jgi:phospholipase C
MVIVEENEGFGDVVGNSQAPYINGQLIPQGALATDYYGTSHQSDDNYISMTSGQPPWAGSMGDCGIQPLNYAGCYQYQNAVYGTANIGDQLEAGGHTWKAYMDGMATAAAASGVSDPNCLHPSTTDVTANEPYSNGYATRHSPFIFYQSIVSDQARCDAHIVDGARLKADLHSGNLPDFSFYVPDTCHDGHDDVQGQGCSMDPEQQTDPNGIPELDSYLRQIVPPVLNSPAFANGVIFIVFDEGQFSDTSGCCGTGPDGQGLTGGGRVMMLALSRYARAGSQDATPYSHLSLLHTIEDIFGIHQYLGQASASGVTSMTGLFNAAAPIPSPSPSVSGTVRSRSATLPNTAGAPGVLLPLLLLLWLPVTVRLCWPGRRP